MDKYILLFRNSEASEAEFGNQSPEDLQAALDMWGAWVGGIAAQGKLVSSDALDAGGKLVSSSKKVVSDGPYVEAKELVSGYLIMEAGSEAEAVEAAKGCPILHLEGSVEVRKFMLYQ